MTEELPTFICKYCGHEVVVHPKLRDQPEKPSVCTPCWDKIVKPDFERRQRELMLGLAAFMDLLGDRLPGVTDEHIAEGKRILEKMRPKDA